MADRRPPRRPRSSGAADPAGTATRRAALRLIDAILRRGDPLDIAMHAATQGLTPTDRAFAVAIVSETLRWMVDIDALIDGATSVELFLHFYDYYISIGAKDIETTKTTLAFGADRRYCYIYQFGKNFISGVIKLDELIDDPELFFKAAAVSGSTYAHHFRLYEKSDLNTSLKKYLKKALAR